MDTRDIYVEEKEVSRITGISLSRLRQDRMKRQGIPVIKVGRSVRYSLSAVHGYMQFHTVKFDEPTI